MLHNLHLNFHKMPSFCNLNFLCPCKRCHVWFPVGSSEIFKWHSFFPHSEALGSTQPLNKQQWIPWNFLQIRCMLRLDNSAILVVPNVKVRMEAKYSIPPPSPESSWLVTQKLYLLFVLFIKHVLKFKHQPSHSKVSECLMAIWLL